MAVNVEVTPGGGNKISVTQPTQTKSVKVQKIEPKNISVQKSHVGGGDKNYVHDQASPSASWTINHNLEKRPSVSVVDSAYNKIICEVEYTSNNQVVLTMDSATSGKAYLN